MAHFAKISDQNEVLTVLTLDNKDALNADGVEDETVGQQYLEQHNHWPAAKWIQTSCNTINNTHRNGGTAFRGNYAGIGYTWDEGNQIFWPPQPYASWVKNLSTAEWDSPIGYAPKLTDDQTAENAAGTHKHVYEWNEAGQSWDLESIAV